MHLEQTSSYYYTYGEKPIMHKYNTLLIGLYYVKTGISTEKSQGQHAKRAGENTFFFLSFFNRIF